MAPACFQGSSAPAAPGIRPWGSCPDFLPEEEEGFIKERRNGLKDLWAKPLLSNTVSSDAAWGSFSSALLIMACAGSGIRVTNAEGGFNETQPVASDSAARCFPPQTVQASSAPGSTGEQGGFLKPQ